MWTRSPSDPENFTATLQWMAQVESAFRVMESRRLELEALLDADARARGWRVESWSGSLRRGPWILSRRLDPGSTQEPLWVLSRVLTDLGVMLVTEHIEEGSDPLALLRHADMLPEPEHPSGGKP